MPAEKLRRVAEASVDALKLRGSVGIGTVSASPDGQIWTVGLIDLTPSAVRPAELAGPVSLRWDPADGEHVARAEF